ncbi:MAG: IS1 family transposase [Promethearchaeota archaeon]
MNTTFVERNNLTLRQQNGRLQRKTLQFSKEKELLNRQMDFFLGVYHFTHPHGGLKRLRNKKKRERHNPNDGSWKDRPSLDIGRILLI